VIQGSSLAPIPPISFELPNIEMIHGELNILGKTTVLSKVISRLKDDTELSSWILHGLGLHKNKGESNCLYCGNIIDPSRVSELEAHFSDELGEFMRTCDEYESLLNQKKILVDLPADHLFYPDLQKEVRDISLSIIESVEKVNNYLDSL